MRVNVLTSESLWINHTQPTWTTSYNISLQIPKVPNVICAMSSQQTCHGMTTLTISALKHTTPWTLSGAPYPWTPLSLQKRHCITSSKISFNPFVPSSGALTSFKILSGYNEFNTKPPNTSLVLQLTQLTNSISFHYVCYHLCTS